MKRVPVEVQEDHLERLSQSGRPVMAVAELIWNALDADAMSVVVDVRQSVLGANEQIVVSDDGHGISENEVEAAFSKLGGSWKRLRERTRVLGRLLHGREGKGRFRAFGLGEQVIWQTRFLADGEVRELTITGTVPNLEYFEITEPTPAAHGATPGTDVLITGIFNSVPDLRADRYAEELSEVFAIYLSQYPHVEVRYCGRRLDPDEAKVRTQTYQLGPVTADGAVITDAELTVVEWQTPKSRSLYLCDADGFTFGRVGPGIHAPGFHFTAYLRASLIRQLADEGALELGEMNPLLSALIVNAKDQLRDHFRARLAEDAATLVQDWKQERSYPFDGEATSPLERAERQMFEVVAFNVSSYVPSIAEGDVSARQLSFRLIRQAIEENPRALRKILQEVVRLPKEAQDDLAELLERTSLASVIEAAREVADRLDFLAGLELLVFNPTSKEQLRERTQLHRIVAEETWVFGEEFNLSVDDRSLNEVLNAHVALLRRETPETIEDNVDLDEPVLLEGGRTGIVDLMLSRRIPQPRKHIREHLVVELKRPQQTINLAVTQQIRKYAYAIQRDDRFKDTGTTWSFWAISNRITDEARENMQDRGKGILHRYEDGRATIYLRTWGEILEECRGRLTFFQERLQYAFDDESALAYLRRAHSKYLPAIFSTDPAG
jgi:hypothetical protein